MAEPARPKMTRQEAGAHANRVRWDRHYAANGQPTGPRYVRLRLTDLTPEQRRIVLAMIHLNEKG